MPPGKCLVCDNAPLRLFVDGSLNKGMSLSGISASVAAIGGKLDSEVIGRHKSRHWVRPADPDAPQPTKRDLAIMMRDKVATAVEDLSPEALLYMGKDMAPIIGKGLQAQAMLDKREVVAQRHGLAAGALALQAFLAGLGNGEPPPELEDGNTIEGVAVEVD